ncbi:MAG: CHAT domain-containing protein, partial [Spirulina sp. SIO3F2]|nr:CHAT domain-containing protein [Spirulina sp. SIO3F2]
MFKTLLGMGGSLILPCVLTVPLTASLTAPTVAQSMTAAPDGTGTIIHHNGDTYHIQGGTQAGANLFHSFHALGLSSGEIANFLSNPSVTNILGRVTGGDPSIIDGLMQVTGANSNLYLMNPAGFVLGQGASLNVGGDFFATTADRIAIGDDWFVSSGVNDYAALVGTPNQFAFLSEEPGAILNFGQLQSEQNVSLIGGTVLNQGQINAATVTVAAVPGERLVRVSQPGMLLSLDIPTEQMAAGITSVDLPTLLTGSGLTTGAFPLQNGDVVIAGEVSGQQVDLYAAGQVTSTDAELIEGDTRVIRFSEMGENPDQAVFIDRRADSPEQLLYGAAAGTVAQIIEKDENGISVISKQLSVISESVDNLESVAIVAEGNAGYFKLGNQWIESDTLSDHAAQLQAWGDALTESADLLLYSCFTALGETGQALIDSLASLTGADVAASTNATGSANYGGDWLLEASTGSIESTNPFSFGILTDWDGKLLIRRVTDFTDSGGANTLRSLIGIALDGDTILFDSPGQTVTLGGTEIAWGTNNLSIDGNGGTVNGNNASRIFNISAENATIQNVTLTNGSTTAVGGAIYHTGTGTLTISNATLSSNTADQGGGIEIINSHAILTNTNVSGNSVTGGGGGVRSNFAGFFTLNNSVVENNSSVVNGGGIRTGSGRITLTDSRVSGNSSGFSGGGIRSDSGWITLNRSTVSGNLAARDGAGIRTGNGTVRLLSNSKVFGNSTSQNGGGIRTGGGNVIVTDSQVYNNTAVQNGGGINTNGGNITLSNATVSGNSSFSYGGGVATNSGSISVTNSTVSDNFAGNGGGARTSTGNITIANSTIQRNVSGNNGGGVRTESGTIAVTNSAISGNTAGGRGGGLYFSAGGTINLADSSLSGNSSVYEGGGIVGYAGEITATRTRISDNTGLVYQTIQAFNTDITITDHPGDLNVDVDAGGELFLSASGSVTVTGRIVPDSKDVDVQAASSINLTGVQLSPTQGGDVTLTAGGDITTKNIFTSVLGSGNGGNITLTSTAGAINTQGNGSAGSLDARGTNGNGGRVTINAAKNINTGAINTEAFNGIGGAVTVESPDSFVTIDGTVSSNFVSFPASISTAGTSGGGSILIRHGGNGLVPFQVGDASINGTSAAITAGGSYTIGVGNSYLYKHIQPGIQILTNGAPAATSLPSVIAGVEPINQTLTTTNLLQMMTEQAGGDVVVNGGSTAGFDVPGEDWPIWGGSFDNSLVMEYMITLDNFFTNQFETPSDGIVEPSQSTEQDDEEGSIANIREVFKKITEQTGTVPAIIYAFSQPDGLELIVITPDEHLRRKVIPEADRQSLRRTIRTFRRRISSIRSDYLDSAQQLHNWFIQPIEGIIKDLNVDTLIFAMGEGLRGLPLAALHDGEQFLVENYSLGQIPSLSLINSRYESLNQAEVVAMGASQFETLQPLPAVPSELALVTSVQSGEHYLNEQFTWDNLERHSRERSFDVVHLATHAAFRAGDTSNSYIQLWGEETIDVESLRQLRWFEEPEVELLVLSACETALGDVDAELGFAGLAVQAGVKSALASLWQVSDLGTLALMNQFYGQLGDPAVTIKAEALRQA